MALNEQDVARLARLAKIELTVKQRSHAQQALNNMLHLINQLKAVNTQHVAPLAHPLAIYEEATLRLREDHATESPSNTTRMALMDNAPQVQDGLFLVPKVLE
jgi:aspartyl-tRNA(Asn)/glutamyl-tRNA(Gln) amidotransferase subunit C